MQYDFLATDWRSVLAIHMTVMTIMIFSMSPDVSFDLWRSIINRWKMRKERTAINRDQEAKDKLRKYYEIDMKEFK